jgi:hypothetical protein
MLLVMQDVDTAARPSLVVARYNALWLQLSRVVRQTGVATCYTYGFYVLYLFLMLTVSMYGLLSALTKGFEPSHVYLVGDTLITGTELYIICDGANSVTREVSAVSYPGGNRSFTRVVTRVVESGVGRNFRRSRSRSR